MGFRETVKNSFLKVRLDVDQLRQYTFEWIENIVNNQRRTLQQMQKLESRIKKIENEYRSVNNGKN
jgi:hypothetical protein